jgi:hypothetical protein
MQSSAARRRSSACATFRTQTHLTTSRPLCSRSTKCRASTRGCSIELVTTIFPTSIELVAINSIPPPFRRLARSSPRYPSQWWRIRLMLPSASSTCQPCAPLLTGSAPRSCNCVSVQHCMHFSLMPEISRSYRYLHCLPPFHTLSFPFHLSHSIPFFETSALNGAGVEAPFTRVISDAIASGFGGIGVVAAPAAEPQRRGCAVM